MSGQNERVLDQFTRQASAYAALVNKGDARADPLVALLNVEPVHHLLDVGCGSGQFAVKVAPLVAEAGRWQTRWRCPWRTAASTGW
jgi:ubiquinone/menaquinone biosynthesis C-methylase UbiE